MRAPSGIAAPRDPPGSRRRPSARGGRARTGVRVSGATEATGGRFHPAARSPPAVAARAILPEAERLAPDPGDRTCGARMRRAAADRGRPRSCAARRSASRPDRCGRPSWTSGPSTSVATRPPLTPSSPSSNVTKTAESFSAGLASSGPRKPFEPTVAGRDRAVVHRVAHVWHDEREGRQLPSAQVGCEPRQRHDVDAPRRARAHRAEVEEGRVLHRVPSRERRAGAGRGQPLLVRVPAQAGRLHRVCDRAGGDEAVGAVAPDAEGRPGDEREVVRQRRVRDAVARVSSA